MFKSEKENTQTALTHYVLRTVVHYLFSPATGSSASTRLELISKHLQVLLLLRDARRQRADGLGHVRQRLTDHIVGRSRRFPCVLGTQLVSDGRPASADAAVGA
eukprot:scaffold177_cov253-Pinguiococcus_pyrenoidosus.AAC.1